jgi:hypothetical protein
VTGHWFSRTVLIFIGGVAAVSACSHDSTGPASDVTVTISITQLTGPDISDQGAGDQRVECTVNLNAFATGSARATWRDATLLFYAGPDRSAPVDSILIPAAEVQDAWGAADIGSGAAQQSLWRISAGIPFGAVLAYRYKTPAGDVRSTRVSFTCGPEVPAGLAPPTITGLTIEPAGNEIEYGESVVVRYVAESNMGLWSTTVRTTGACALEQTVSERLLTHSERTVVFVIPPSCAQGQLVSFVISATDAVLQTVTMPGLRSFAVVDRTPPQVYADHMPAATDFFFAGDTVRPFIAAQDNHSVRSIVWEVQPGGIRDSIAGWGGRFIDIPIRPEWAGARMQIRVFARDASGLVSDTITAPVSGLPIYPTVQLPTRWATISGDVMDLAVDEKRGALYVVQGNGGARVGVVSLSNLALSESIPLPVLAWDLDLSAGGDSLILALPYLRALGIIDLRESPRRVQLLTIRSLDTATQQAPWQLRVGANGKAYVILEGPPPASPVLLEVDLTTGAERTLPDAGNIQDARYERSFDRSALIFQRGVDLFERYDVSAGTFSALGTPHSIYGPLRVDVSGSHVTLGLDVFDASLGFLRRLPSVYGGEAVRGAALSKDGAYFYSVLGFRGVARTRTTDGVVLDRLPTPFSASGYLRVSPDGNTLIVVDSFLGTARIALLDLR